MRQVVPTSGAKGSLILRCFPKRVARGRGPTVSEKRYTSPAETVGSASPESHSDTALAPDALRGMRVGVLCGLASPTGFERSLESLGALIVARRILPDHHRYRIDDLRSLHADVDCWVTTEKDAVKIPPGWLGSLDLRVLTMELEVERADELLDWIEVRLASI